MTRKDFTLAAQIVRSTRVRFAKDGVLDPEQDAKASAMEEGFVDFFVRSEGRFDEARFRAACEA